MKLLNNIKTYISYLLVVFLFCSIGFLITDNQNFLIIMMLSTTPIIFGVQYSKFVGFSDKIEIYRKDIYEKYKSKFTVPQRLNLFSTFNNSDFKNMGNNELQNQLKLVHQLIFLVFISFGINIILLIGLNLI